MRHSRDNKKNLLFVCNFTPMERPDYRVGVPRRKQLKLVLDSDDPKYGRKGVGTSEGYISRMKQECDGQKYSIAYPLQPYGVAVFEVLKIALSTKEIENTTGGSKKEALLSYFV